MSTCDLCSSSEDTTSYQVEPREDTIQICSICHNQIQEPSTLNQDHWGCLSETMWSQEPAIQVMAYRLLRLLGEQDFLDQMYLDDEIFAWAQSKTL